MTKIPGKIRGKLNDLFGWVFGGILISVLYLGWLYRLNEFNLRRRGSGYQEGWPESDQRAERSVSESESKTSVGVQPLSTLDWLAQSPNIFSAFSFRLPKHRLHWIESATSTQSRFEKEIIGISRSVRSLRYCHYQVTNFQDILNVISSIA